MDNQAFFQEESIEIETSFQKNYLSISTEAESSRSNNKLSKDLILSYLRQVILAAIISSGSNVAAFLVGSTSLLPSIINANLANQEYTSQDLKWLASGPILFTIFGNFVAVYLTEKYGPTFMLRNNLLICFLLYLLEAFMPTMTVLWITRTLMWTIVGIFDIISVPLIALLSEPNIRGMSGVLSDLSGSFCYLLVFVTFAFVSGTYAIMIMSVPVLMGFIGSLFVPESPFWLIQRGKQLEAERSIARAIGPSRSEKREEILQELLARYKINDVENTGQLNRRIPFKKQIVLLGKSKNWKPILLSIFIFALREFGGNHIIFFYAIIFFKSAGISIDVFLCTISISVARVLSTFLSASFQDRFGRRIVLIGTTLMSAICLIVSGLILHLDFKGLNIIPLIMIIIFTVMAGVGIGPVSFIILGEIVPSDIKFLGTAIVYAFFTVFQFVIVAAIPSVLNTISVGMLLIAFSILNLVCAIILYFILPETKCRTLKEVEQMFK